MSDITREKARELASPTGAYDGYNEKVLQDFANAVRADFARELLGMDVEPAGTAAYMPGTTGYTMAAFRAEDVPVGTSLLTTTQAAAMVLQEREKCAKVCERRAEDRFSEIGITEPDTGAQYYTGRAADAFAAMDEEDHDCAEAIRMAEKVELPEYIKHDGPYAWTDEEVEDYAREAITAAIVKLTQGPRPMSISQLACCVDSETRYAYQEIQRLIKTIKYMVGIAERGRGFGCPADESPEKFLLDYVKDIEASQAETQTPEAIAAPSQQEERVRELESVLDVVLNQLKKWQANGGVKSGYEFIDVAITVIDAARSKEQGK